MNPEPLKHEESTLDAAYIHAPQWMQEAHDWYESRNDEIGVKLVKDRMLDYSLKHSN